MKGPPPNMPPNPLSLPCTGRMSVAKLLGDAACVSDHVTWGVCIQMLGVYPQLSDACVKSIAPQELGGFTYCLRKCSTA